MNKNTILSLKDIVVEFSVRNNKLTAIRNVSLDIDSNKVLAIVGESGSGKSVLTKTFTGMLDDNGQLAKGQIWYKDSELTEEYRFFNMKNERKLIRIAIKKEIKEIDKSNKISPNNELLEKKNNIIKLLKQEEELYREYFKKFNNVEKELVSNYNKKKKNEIKDLSNQLKGANEETKKNIKEQISIIKGRKFINNTHKNPEINELNKQINNVHLKIRTILNIVEDNTGFETWTPLHNFSSNKEWQKIRGKRIAVVFQDPMTSLNPLISIGKQIAEVIIIHRKLSKSEAKKEAIQLLKKVGILDAEKRYNDYPFQYSGGMRQRVVIAIALACQPKILICDEPTTALDVTIQAQILSLIKSLQKEYGFCTIYITHDLGVVANVADEVAVMYGGQIIEKGTVEEIFYDPRHPYTWSLLSSLPQLGTKDKELFSIPGTPPSLFHKIVGDAFAPRNPYALEIDFVEEPPIFQISETHYAKTWLLDSRAPKVEKPDGISALKEKVKSLNDQLARSLGEDGGKHE